MSAINITQVQVLVRLFQILSFLFFYLSLRIFFVFWKSSVVVRQWGVGALSRRSAREDDDINNNIKYDEKTKINAGFLPLFLCITRGADNFILLFLISLILKSTTTGQSAIFSKPVTVWNPIRVPDEPSARLGVETHVRWFCGERPTRPNLRHSFSRASFERRV